MANLIRTQNLVDTTKRALAKFIIISDGTNEANTVLLDVSTLSNSLNANGYIMVGGVHPLATYRTTVKRVFGSVKANNATIRLKWHGDANSEMLVFGEGNFDFNFESMGDVAVISNPEANSSGDILITTTGLQAGDVATIFIDVRKDNRDYAAGQFADPYAFNRGVATI
jgi:hypothetical protein